MLYEMEKLVYKLLASYSTTRAKEGLGSVSTTEYYYQAQKVNYFVTAGSPLQGLLYRCESAHKVLYRVELMRDIIVALNTQGWEKLLEESDSLDEVLRLVRI